MGLNDHKEPNLHNLKGIGEILAGQSIAASLDPLRGYSVCRHCRQCGVTPGKNRGTSFCGDAEVAGAGKRLRRIEGMPSGPFYPALRL